MRAIAAIGVAGMAALAASLWGLRDVRQALIDLGHRRTPEDGQ